jgi:molybdenum-dependent DNA-binding transcriptional regulator ModE
MDNTLKHRIIELVSRDISEQHSIADIAKKLSVAYSHAHTFVKKLVSEDVLKIKKIGNVSVCSLNLKSQMTLAYLSLIEARKTREWLAKNPHADKIIEKIDLVRDSIHVAMIKNNNVILIVPEHTTGVDFSAFRNRSVMTSVQMLRNKKMYADAVILHGAEKYWSMMR